MEDRFAELGFGVRSEEEEGEEDDNGNDQKDDRKEIKKKRKKKKGKYKEKGKIDKEALFVVRLQSMVNEFTTFMNSLSSDIDYLRNLYSSDNPSKWIEIDHRDFRSVDNINEINAGVLERCIRKYLNKGKEWLLKFEEKIREIKRRQQNQRQKSSNSASSKNKRSAFLSILKNAKSVEEEEGGGEEEEDEKENSELRIHESNRRYCQSLYVDALQKFNKIKMEYKEEEERKTIEKEEQKKERKVLKKKKKKRKKKKKNRRSKSQTISSSSSTDSLDDLKFSTSSGEEISRTRPKPEMASEIIHEKEVVRFKSPEEEEEDGDGITSSRRQAMRKKWNQPPDSPIKEKAEEEERKKKRKKKRKSTSGGMKKKRKSSLIEKVVSEIFSSGSRGNESGKN